MSVSVKLFCVCILAIGLDAKPFPDVRDVVSNGPEVFVFTLPGSSGIQGQQIGSYGINRVATRRSLEKPPSATSATKAEQSNVIQSETDDSITFPDDVVRDSYGNAVTPFSAIPGTDKIKNRIGSDEVAFLLPSYADGILAKLPETPKSNDYTSNDIQIPSTDLQPPLSSGNFNYGLRPDIKAKSPESHGPSAKHPTAGGEAIARNPLSSQGLQSQPPTAPPPNTAAPSPHSSHVVPHVVRSTTTTTTTKPILSHQLHPVHSVNDSPALLGSSTSPESSSIAPEIISEPSIFPSLPLSPEDHKPSAASQPDVDLSHEGNPFGPSSSFSLHAPVTAHSSDANGTSTPLTVNLRNNPFFSNAALLPSSSIAISTTTAKPSTLNLQNNPFLGSQPSSSLSSIPGINPDVPPVTEASVIITSKPHYQNVHTNPTTTTKPSTLNLQHNHFLGTSKVPLPPNTNPDALPNTQVPSTATAKPSTYHNNPINPFLGSRPTQNVATPTTTAKPRITVPTSKLPSVPNVNPDALPNTQSPSSTTIKPTAHNNNPVNPFLGSRPTQNAVSGSATTTTAKPIASNLHNNPFFASNSHLPSSTPKVPSTIQTTAKPSTINLQGNPFFGAKGAVHVPSVNPEDPPLVNSITDDGNQNEEDYNQIEASKFLNPPDTDPDVLPKLDEASASDSSGLNKNPVHRFSITTTTLPSTSKTTTRDVDSVSLQKNVNKVNSNIPVVPGVNPDIPPQSSEQNNISPGLSVPLQVPSVTITSTTVRPNVVAHSHIPESSKPQIIVPSTRQALPHTEYPSTTTNKPITRVPPTTVAPVVAVTTKNPNAQNNFVYGNRPFGSLAPIPATNPNLPPKNIQTPTTKPNGFLNKNPFFGANPPKPSPPPPTKPQLTSTLKPATINIQNNPFIHPNPTTSGHVSATPNTAPTLNTTPKPTSTQSTGTLNLQNNPFFGPAGHQILLQPKLPSATKSNTLNLQNNPFFSQHFPSQPAAHTPQHTSISSTSPKQSYSQNVQNNRNNSPSTAEVPASNYHHQSASFPTLAPGTFPTLALAASFPTLAPIQAAAAPNVQQPQSQDNSLVVVTRGPHNAVQSVVTGNVQAPAAVNSGSYGNALQNNPFFNGAAGASGALVSTGVKTGFVSTSSAAKPYAINPSNPFIYG